MNLRILIKLVICSLGLGAFVASCNDNDSSYELGVASSDAQIKSFAIAAIATNKADSLAFPTMGSTGFTIINKGTYLIYNVDSLHHQTDIDGRSLKVTVEFSSTPASVDLVYRDKNGGDSIPEESWNTTDSVKFFKLGNEGRYIPDFKVIAPDGTERKYTIKINIATTDPDLIDWTKVENAQGGDFSLLKKGENKTIGNADNSVFYSLTNDGSNVYIYSSSAVAPKWENLKDTKLPKNTMAKSFQLVDGYFIVGTQDGKVYTVKEDGDWTQWTEYATNNVKAILGVLPDYQNSVQNNLLLIVDKGNNILTFAKAKADNMSSITELTSASSKDGLVPEGFPLVDFSSLAGAALVGLDSKYLLLTGGTDAAGKVVNRSWMLSELSDNKIESLGSYKDDLAEYKYGVTTFGYADKMYMIANDSIYTSVGYGSDWQKADEKEAFKEDMIKGGMDMPSVIVDKDKFIWIFGGKFKNGSGYSTSVWKGRLNRLTHKRIN